MPVKKKTTKKTAAKKTTRPVVSKKSSSGPAKRGRPAKNAVAPKKRGRPAKKATAKKKESAPREFDEVTGFVIGTDQHVIAEALIEGAATRQDIIDELKETLDTETRNGTEKPVSNLVASVTAKLLDRGFTVEGSYALVPPAKKSRGRRK